MERLVVVYTQTDGCTYSAITTVPIEYESSEKLIVDFEDRIIAYCDGNLDAIFPDRYGILYEYFLESLNVDDAMRFKGDKDVLYCKPRGCYCLICLPEIYELNEWFDKNKS